MVLIVMKGTYKAVLFLILFLLMIHDLYYILNKLNKLILLIHVTTVIFEQNDTHYKPHHDFKKIIRTLPIPISFFMSHCITTFKLILS